MLIVVRELKAHQPACTIFPCFSVCLYILSLSLSVYLKKNIYFYLMCICVLIMALRSLELGLQTAVSCHVDMWMWIPGIEPRSSGRAVSV